MTKTYSSVEEMILDISDDPKFIVELIQQLAHKQAFLTIEQAAQHVGLSAKSIRRLIESGKIRPLRPVRGKIVLDRLELESYVRSCTGNVRNGRGKHQR